MAQRVNVGVAGLGVMGQRMLARIKPHPRLQVARIWDANPDTLSLCHARHPELAMAHSAEDLVRAGIDALYVATPPAGHMALCQLAFDAGLPVLCEAPLARDLELARRAVRRIAEGGLRAAVNFPLASSLGLATLCNHFSAATPRTLGDLHDVVITLELGGWPRPWQAASGHWLRSRAEGGFVREVLSHFIFMLQRVLGPATVWQSALSFGPDGSGTEVKLSAELHAGEVPVRVSGRVDPALGVAERIEMRWYASEGSIVLHNWYGLELVSRGGVAQSPGDVHSMRLAAQALHLVQWLDLIEGRAHSLPGFAEALAVQETVEDLLRAR